MDKLPVLFNNTSPPPELLAVNVPTLLFAMNDEPPTDEITKLSALIAPND